MISKKAVISSKTGLSARVASKFVRETMRYKCSISIEYEGNTYDAKSIISVLAARVRPQSEILLICSGDSENQAMEGILASIAKGLN